jgi:putative glutamine amidotransferase
MAHKPVILVLEAGNSSSACIRAAGGEPVTQLPTDSEAIAFEICNGIDGVLLTGGSDVNPKLYTTEPKHKEVYGVNDRRDRIESLVLDAAAKMSIPVMGICRGSQIMNVWAGGTLHQDIGKKHWGCKHPIASAPGSIVRLFGGRKPWVQSFHHQEIDKPGNGFIVTARAIDPAQTVETIESGNGLMLGVQFHPEMLSNSAHAKGLFGWLVKTAKRAEPHKPPEDVLDALWAIGPVPVPKSITTGSSKPHKGGKTPTERLYDLPGIDEVKSARQSAAVFMGEEAASMMCPICGIVFEEILDRLDHEDMVHGVVARGSYRFRQGEAF